MKEFLTSLGGWKLKRWGKSFGYTLIELVAVIAISTIAMSIGLTLIITTYKSYSKTIEEGIREDEVDNALITIERLLTRYMIIEIRPNVTNNKLEIDNLDEYGKEIVITKSIEYKNGNIVIKTYNKLQPDYVLSTNTILKGVSGFKIIKKENIYYYKITLKTGDEIIQCV